MGRNGKNEIGNVYGRLTVTDELRDRIRGARAFKCRCECGNDHVVTGGDLRTGKVNSCGCYKREYITNKNTIHGLRDSRLYKIFHGMKQRCYNENNPSYHNYGGRGIRISEEWLISFELFYNWSIDNGYSEELSIDRIDVNGNYEPSNCKWSTTQEQSENKTTTLYFEINNETYKIKDLSNKYNLDANKLRIYYYRNGKNIIKALNKMGVILND